MFDSKVKHAWFIEQVKTKQKKTYGPFLEKKKKQQLFQKPL